MKRILPVIVLLCVVLNVTAIAPVTATFTGRSKQGYSVTYKWVISCEYVYNFNKYFWETFPSNHCPYKVEVY